jgi:hypothetical protein
MLAHAITNRTAGSMPGQPLRWVAKPMRNLGPDHAAPPKRHAITASLIIGALAGLIPALRAARLSPTQALWSV